MGSVVLAYLTSITFPLWSLVWGPLLLGVPHLVAGVRYLVVAPNKTHARMLLWAAVPLVAVSMKAGPAIGLLAVVLALQASHGPWWPRRGPVLVLWALGTAWAAYSPTSFQGAFLHLHNFIALAWWWAFRPRAARFVWVPLLAFFGVAMLLLGAADGWVNAFGGWHSARLQETMHDFVQILAPMSNGTMAARCVLVFAFLQSLHYAIWLRLIPEDARKRVAPRTFRASWQALRQDFGRWPLLWASGMCLAFLVWGVFNAMQARAGYLQLAAFHGYLELAAAAYFFVEQRRPC